MESKINQKIDPNLDAIFSRFLSQLGSILGGFWPPSWSQVGTKWHQNPTPQPIKKIIAFWKGSGSILGGFWAPTWGGCKVVVGWLFWLLGPSWGQDGPRTPQDRLQDRFWSDSSWFLVDIWWIGAVILVELWERFSLILSLSKIP